MYVSVITKVTQLLSTNFELKNQCYYIKHCMHHLLNLKASQEKVKYKYRLWNVFISLILF